MHGDIWAGTGVPGREIAIAGGGVAGLACAALLAREGERVVVYDRMEMPSPLGSGLILQPVGLAALDVIGVGERLRESGAAIKRLYGRVQPSGRVVLNVRYGARGREAAGGVGVHRGALFETLHDAAIAMGADFVRGREVVGASDGRLLFAGGQKSAKADLVIDALGVRSPLARDRLLPPLDFGALWANLDWSGPPFDETALEQRYEAARKMAGVLPIGRVKAEGPRQAAFFWSLKHADVGAWQARGLEAWKAGVLRLWPQTEPLLDQIRHREQLIFAAYTHGTLRTPLSREVVHIGDSWHSASPQLGQGANMALLDALALARGMAAHREVGAAAEAYKRARLMHIRLYQLASWMFTPAYQSDGRVVAWVRDWLMSPLSRVWPTPKILAALVAGSIGSPLTAIEAIGDR